MYTPRHLLALHVRRMQEFVRMAPDSFIAFEARI
jgi:hypothetical protein